MFVGEFTCLLIPGALSLAALQQLLRPSPPKCWSYQPNSGYSSKQVA